MHLLFAWCSVLVRNEDTFTFISRYEQRMDNGDIIDAKSLLKHFKHVLYGLKK